MRRGSGGEEDESAPPSGPLSPESALCSVGSALGRALPLPIPAGAPRLLRPGSRLVRACLAREVVEVIVLGAERGDLRDGAGPGVSARRGRGRDTR